PDPHMDLLFVIEPVTSRPDWSSACRLRRRARSSGQITSEKAETTYCAELRGGDCAGAPGAADSLRGYQHRAPAKVSPRFACPCPRAIARAYRCRPSQLRACTKRKYTYRQL